MTGKSLPPNAIVILAPGRMGDLIAAEPIFRRAHEAEPSRPMVLFTLPPYAEVMRYCPYLERIEVCANKAELRRLAAELPADCRVIKINFGGEVAGATPADNLLHCFQLENRLPVTDDTARFYLSDAGSAVLADLPPEYLVFHCCSGGKSRQWPLKNWRRLAEFCRSSGMPVVEVGYGSVLDLSGPGYFPRCGTVSLDEVGHIIRHAKAVIGVESGMLHLANALDTFGFVITGALRDLPEYNHYCGRYYRGENCNFLRFFNCNPFELPYAVVEKVVGEFLAGRTLSFLECENFLLKEQLARQDAAFLRRVRRAAGSFLLKQKMAIQFRYCPRRPKS